MCHSDIPSRPPHFYPADDQRRWVRDRHAAIRRDRQWIRLIRIDRVDRVMVDAPHDHEDSGRWMRQSASVWAIPAVGASFASLDDAAEWIAAIPQM
jgi:hypothetical protein